MLRIAIADDEERIRRGLAKLVSAASDDYVVAGVFANGAELLRFIEEEGADVVITDIRMPVMDGLQVAKRLHASHPEVRCIIVSGYNDFDYARTAIRYRVQDYLLKPVDKAELYRLLETAAEELVEIRRRAKAVRRLRLEQALAGNAGEEPIIWDDEYAVWYVIRTEEPVDPDLLEAAAAGSEDGTAAAIAVREGVYALLLKLPPGASLTDATERAGAALASALAERTGAAVGASLPFRGAGRFKEAYGEAELAAGQAIYRFERAVFITAAELQHPAGEPVRLGEWLKLWEEGYVRALQLLDVPQLERELNTFFDELRRRKEPPGVLAELLIRLITVAEREVQGFAEEADQAFGPHGERRGKLSSFFKFDRLRQWYTEQLTHVIERVRLSRGAGVRAVDAVKAIIASSYHEEWDLGRLAERVYLTPSYLSKLFKQETGMTITDYLIGVRIEQAKKLLRNRPDLKTYEVGVQVGYPDSAYFTKLFKRIVGTTPNEFRQRVR